MKLPRIRIPKFVFYLFLLVLLVAPALLNRYGGFAFSPVLSGSMRGTFNPGDILLTKPILVSKIKVGDVVVAHDPLENSNFAHRVIKIDRNSTVTVLATKGDSNPTIDSPATVVANGTYMARMIAHFPWIGQLVVWFNHPIGRKVAIDGFLLIFVGRLVYRLLVMRRKRT